VLRSTTPIKFHIAAHDRFFVLRDDLLPGGTKYRGLINFLETIPDKEIAYAGTVMGYGALALAHACNTLGKTAHIVIAGESTHPMIERLGVAGARLHLSPRATIERLHEQAKTLNARCLPPGFATPEFEMSLAESLRSVDVSTYPEIWSVAVTGTVSNALRRAFPDKIIRTVSVVKSTQGDYQAPEKYHQSAKSPPPWPACPHTDAKLWQSAQKHATPGTLLWNTAG
jgi:hypothetical protein